MAKSEDQSSSSHSHAGGSQPFRSHESNQASGNAHSAARHAQAGFSEFISEDVVRPYAELTEHMESSARQWAEGVRNSVDQTISVASKMNETWMNEARRLSGLYLQMLGAGVSAHRGFSKEALNQARQKTYRAEAAE